MVDVFFYADPQSAAESNYIKLRNKPLKASTARTRKARSKESVEVLVDRALAADDIPAYLHDKRDSIVNQVNSGKSVEQVITLLRAIFG